MFNQLIIRLHEDSIHYCSHNCKTMYPSLYVIAKNIYQLWLYLIPIKRLSPKFYNIIYGYENETNYHFNIYNAYYFWTPYMQLFKINF